ncbi:MAG: hypothetical protein JO246_02445 [Frankiaceae bacterium]|nr:hypothetical protein [Frankiaceae bacterium]MBV9872388.1 hypothetical protein [Frankiaceae bacterium]
MSETSAQDRQRLLTEFGASADADVVWRMLLRNPAMSAPALASLVGLDLAAVERAIDELLAANLVRGGSSATGVVPIDPTLSMESRIVRAERAVAERLEALALVRAQIPALSEEFMRGRAPDHDLPGFEVVTGLDNIRTQVYLAGERVRHDIRATEHHMTPSPDFAHGRACQLALLDRGVRDRTIVSSDALAHPALRAEYLLMRDHGHQARTLPDITTRIIIYDRDLAIVPVDPTRLECGAIFIRVPSIIDAYILMYEYMWDAATPVFELDGAAGAPTGRVARVLELVAVGAKDEAIARSLDVGTRTIRRDVADLKSVLGVSSRTELATAALRRGWL